MGKKGKDKEPEPVVLEEIPEPEGWQEHPPPPPETSSRILADLGWEVFVMPATLQKYFFSKRRREARVQAPYFEVLSLPENDFRTITKEDIWKAFFVRRASFKKADEGGSLTEELTDERDQVDWDLVMEAYRVLTDHEARSEYEVRNLLPHARPQLVGLRVQHEARLCHEAAVAKVRPEERPQAAA